MKQAIPYHSVRDEVMVTNTNCSFHLIRADAESTLEKNIPCSVCRMNFLAQK
jgi:hypothetical protein